MNASIQTKPRGISFNFCEACYGVPEMVLVSIYSDEHDEVEKFTRALNIKFSDALNHFYIEENPGSFHGVTYQYRGHFQSHEVPHIFLQELRAENLLSEVEYDEANLDLNNFYDELNLS